MIFDSRDLEVDILSPFDDMSDRLAWNFSTLLLLLLDFSLWRSLHSSDIAITAVGVSTFAVDRVRYPFYII